MPKYAVTLTGMFQVTADSHQSAYDSAVSNIWAMMGEYFNTDDDHLMFLYDDPKRVTLIPEDDEEDDEEEE